MFGALFRTLFVIRRRNSLRQQVKLESFKSFLHLSYLRQGPGTHSSRKFCAKCSKSEKRKTENFCLWARWILCRFSLIKELRLHIGRTILVFGHLDNWNRHFGLPFADSLSAVCCPSTAVRRLPTVDCFIRLACCTICTDRDEKASLELFKCTSCCQLWVLVECQVENELLKAAHAIKPNELRAIDLPLCRIMAANCRWNAFNVFGSSCKLLRTIYYKSIKLFTLQTLCKQTSD